MNDNSLTDPLSLAGRQRRDEMLGDLMVEMERVHRRRRTRRTVLASTALPVIMLVVMAMFWLTGSSVNENPESLVEQTSGSTANTAGPAMIVTRVQSDPTIVDRWRASSSASIQQMMVDDSQLLAALNEIDRPAGLIRSEGRAWLSRNVIDPINADRQDVPKGL